MLETKASPPSAGGRCCLSLVIYSTALCKAEIQGRNPHRIALHLCLTLQVLGPGNWFASIMELMQLHWASSLPPASTDPSAHLMKSCRDHGTSHWQLILCPEWSYYWQGLLTLEEWGPWLTPMCLHIGGDSGTVLLDWCHSDNPICIGPCMLWRQLALLHQLEGEQHTPHQCPSNEVCSLCSTSVLFPNSFKNAL